MVKVNRIFILISFIVLNLNLIHVLVFFVHLVSLNCIEYFTHDGNQQVHYANEEEDQIQLENNPNEMHYEPSEIAFIDDTLEGIFL